MVKGRLNWLYKKIMMDIKTSMHAKKKKSKSAKIISPSCRIQTFIKQSLKMKTCMPNHIIKTREKKGQNRLNSFILQFLQTPQIQ